ncbi:hypothetical protein O3Q51_02935 [Cryomorphaceae bacterium 1068]|nr:hypothetical protein [Cryomorphaceae bacterium 1068]
MTTLKWFSLSIALFFLASCAQVEENMEKNSEEVLIESSGFFRGYKMGWTTDSLQANEKWNPVVSNDSTIEYKEEVVIMDDTVILQSYLAFDAYGLFEVQVDVFIDDDTLSDDIIDQWSTILSRPFGEAENLLSSKRWTTFSKSNNTVEITLSQERNRENRKFISLNYLEPLDDEY